MEQKADKFYLSAHLKNKNDDLEIRIEKKLSDVNSFNNSNINIKMIAYFIDKIYKSKKKNKKYKTRTTKLKSFDTIVIIATTSGSITLSPTGFGLLVIPISRSIACRITISNEVIYEILLQKYNKYKKQYDKDNELLNLLINYIGDLYKTMWFLKMNMNLYVANLLSIWMKRELNLFYKYEHKNKFF